MPQLPICWCIPPRHKCEWCIAVQPANRCCAVCRGEVCVTCQPLQALLDTVIRDAAELQRWRAAGSHLGWVISVRQIPVHGGGCTCIARARRPASQLSLRHRACLCLPLHRHRQRWWRWRRVDLHVCQCLSSSREDLCTARRGAVHRSKWLRVSSGAETRTRSRSTDGCRGTQAGAVATGRAAGLYAGLQLLQLGTGCRLSRMRRGCGARAGLRCALPLTDRSRPRAARRLRS